LASRAPVNFFEDLPAVRHVDWRALQGPSRGERQENSHFFCFPLLTKFVNIQNHLGVSGNNGKSAPSAVNKPVSESNMPCKKAPNTASVASLAEEECFDDLGVSGNNSEFAPMLREKAPNTASLASLAKECFDDLGNSVTRRTNPVAERSLMRAYKSVEREDKKSGMSGFRERDRKIGPCVKKGDRAGKEGRKEQVILYNKMRSNAHWALEDLCQNFHLFRKLDRVDV
jgi:hypothetical protein